MKRQFRAATKPTILIAVLAAATSLGWAVSDSKNDNLAVEAGSTFATSTADSAPGVPRLVNFSGVLKDSSGKPVTGPVTLTFSLYEEQTGGTPLWSETQSVRTDEQGRYTALLGVTLPEGMPQDLFTSTKARWLGVQPQLPEVGELPRALLVGVPYALKAGDAETLGGKPASAYLTADSANFGPSVSPGGTAVQNANPATKSTSVIAAVTTSQPAATTTGTGTTNFVPLWTSSSTLGNSTLFQLGSNVGIGTTTPVSTLDIKGGATVRGALQLPPVNTASATAGFNSNPQDLLASSFNSGAKAAVNQDFRWQAEPVGNNSAAPSGKLDLLFGSGTTAPAETGLSISSKGIITFAPGQTLPTVTGAETLTGNLTASQLDSTVATGTPPLVVKSTTQVPNLNASLLDGLPANAFAQLAASNTFTGNQTITGVATATSLSLPVTSGPMAGVLLVGGGAFLHETGGTSNTYVGAASGGTYTNTGTFNSAYGNQSLYANSTGFYNTAIGGGALMGNTAGGQNVGLGASAGSNNTTGNKNLFLGTYSNPSAGNLTNATAIGYGATVGQSNALILGGAGGNAVNVGIGTSTPPYPLTLQADDNGSTRGGPHQFMIQGHSNPNKQLLIGYLADGGADNGYGAIQATFANVMNTPLALNPNGGQVYVGLSTSFVGNPFVIGPGQGAALADGWSTYSSRRWKTNIQTLPHALDKVERLRGVSYDLKENGKHEIGVIAEEVGQVVPEIVEWDKNGKDANGVDYSRLTALLIEATKQQQREIQQQQAQLTSAVRELHHEKALLHAQAIEMERLRADVRLAKQSLQEAKVQLARQGTLTASR